MKMLIRIGLVAVIVRFAYFLQHTASPFFARPLLDQHYYDLCARQLAGAGGGIIDGFRPLLYPLFLSVFYTLDLDGGIILSLIVQHVLGIAMTVLVAGLAMRIFDSTKAGVIAGLLFCFSAPPLYFEGELLITTLFSFLLLLLWLVLFYALKKTSQLKSVSLWILAGVLLGLSAQARPNALPLLLFFPALTFTRWVIQKERAFSSIAPLFALIGVLAIQILFGAMSSKYSGQFSLMTQAGGINFYLGNSQKADGMIPRQSKHVVYEGEYRDPIQVMAEQGYLEHRTAEQGILNHEVSQQDISEFWKNKTLDEIVADPARWLGLMVKKTWLMFWNHEVPNNRSFAFAASQETPILRWLPVRWWLLLALFPWGITALIKNRQHELVLWVLSFLILFSGTVVLFFVNSRFRIPLWPGLVIIGGGGVTYLWSTLKLRRAPIVPIACSIALLLLSTINWFGIPPDPIENDLSMRANAYYDQGRYDEALPDILECIKIAPNNPRYHFLFGNILLAQENPDVAIKAFLKALSLDSTDPMFHNNLGIAFEESGNPKQAMVAYRKALELQPNHRAALVNLFLLSIQTDQLDLAKHTLQQIPAEQQNHASLQCAIFILRYKETGDANFLSRAEEINRSLAEQLTLSD